VALRRARLASIALIGTFTVLAAAPVAAVAAPARSTSMSTSTSSDPETTLADRYAPVVRLVDRSGSCGDSDAFEPTNVDAVLDSPDVALRGPWEATNLVKVAPTAADLSVGLPGYNLDFPGNALSPGCTYLDWARQIAATSPPTVYSHIATEAGYPDKLSLQYWFFYVYNDWNNKHEGDWENIQLIFNASTPQEALTVSPTEVGYSQHESSERATWGSSKLQIVDDTHPVVYPSIGSHANYFTSNLYLGRSAAQGVGCDDTVGPSTEIRPTVSVIPQETSAYLAKYPWLGYVGRWGERQRSFFNGPTGPNDKDSWTKPISTANDNWRDTSYAIPEGRQLGRTATHFFCAAVGRGSVFLTSLVGDPSPTLFVLFAVIVLIIWLASRTSWSPSAPLRIRRRRAWGSLITSSARMYFRHPKVFLGIGLLFIPIGIITAGIQYLLFRIGNLSPLVDTVGSSNAFVELLVFLLGLLTTLLGLTIVQAATAIAMVELDAGRPVRPIRLYRLALDRAGPLMKALFTAIVVIVALDLTIVGAVIGLWLLIRWSLLAQATIADRKQKPTPLRGSAALTRRHWWKTASITGFVAGLGLVIGPLLGTILLFVTTASFDVVNITTSVLNVAVLPFVAIATTYLFFDLEVRERFAEPKPDTSGPLPAEI
jgi:hypothetical protein